MKFGLQVPSFTYPGGTAEIYLARIDGTSPVEYLDTAQRQLVRAIGRTLLQKPAPTVAEVKKLVGFWAG